MNGSFAEFNKNEELSRFCEQVAYLQKKIDELKGIESNNVFQPSLSVRSSLNQQSGSPVKQLKFPGVWQEKGKDKDKVYFYKSP